MTTNRLEAFSDGVLAIAITLLVIDIRPPELGQDQTLAHALWAQWPSYAAYLVSFLTIGSSPRSPGWTGRCCCSTSTCCCGPR